MAEENIWKQIGDGIVGVAPTLGAVLAPFTGGTSAIVGGAIGALGKAFGLGEKASPEAIQQAIAADPQASLKLMLAEQEFILKQREQDLTELKTRLDDVQDARKKDADETKATGKRDINLYVLAWVIVIGFFVLMGLLLKIPVPEDQNGVIFMLFGSLATGFGQVLQYFFGSSAGSAEKTLAMAQIRKQIVKEAK